MSTDTLAILLVFLEYNLVNNFQKARPQSQGVAA